MSNINWNTAFPNIVYMKKPKTPPVPYVYSPVGPDGQPIPPQAPVAAPTEAAPAESAVVEEAPVDETPAE